jgi:vacuolar iron transporter family protein
MPHKKFAKLDDSIKTGISFGITSGVITTLGIIIGLYTGTQQQVIVVGGVITIAIADALSDAFGMHISQESIKGNNSKAVWKATFSTLIAKFVFAISFLGPLLLLKDNLAVIISILWGSFLIIILSHVIARQENESELKIIIQHLVMMIIVIFLTYLVGFFINIYLINN